VLYQISSSFAGCPLSQWCQKCIKRKDNSVELHIGGRISKIQVVQKVECISLGRDDAMPIMITVTFTASCYDSER